MVLIEMCSALAPINDKYVSTLAGSDGIALMWHQRLNCLTELENCVCEFSDNPAPLRECISINLLVASKVDKELIASHN
ncbi:hypothetical protein [Vibrio nigripulchritudo]|uniref:hypothetical protein n=1 Tax=Vibrio nigripulchritudo TaxID=28173 RepID=UPI00138DD1C0|nr:hypothetical protein [Vibrio nigripulchritudo]